MKRSTSFSALLYESFTACSGPFVAVAGIALSAIGYFVIPASAELPLRWVLLAGLMVLYITILSVHAAWTAYHQTADTLPPVIYAAQAPSAYQPAVALLLLKPSELFSYDDIVAVYRERQENEEIFGVGRVTNVQENGKIQVAVMHDFGYATEWSEIKQNKAELLRELIVKPRVPQIAMEAMLNG